MILTRLFNPRPQTPTFLFSPRDIIPSPFGHDVLMPPLSRHPDPPTVKPHHLAMMTRPLLSQSTQVLSNLSSHDKTQHTHATHTLA